MLEAISPELIRLQQQHGAQTLRPILGGGCVDRPLAMFVFMNPTGRNVSSDPSWEGIRAPWLGVRSVWEMFHALKLIDDGLAHAIKHQAGVWTPAFASALYTNLAAHQVYVTNLAKCTQIDARPLPNTVFRSYLPSFHREIAIVNPERIVTFGNQVSSILIGTAISVGQYCETESPRIETIEVDSRSFPVHPVHYPVGQGRRNLPLAIRRLKEIFR